MNGIIVFGLHILNDSPIYSLQAGLWNSSAQLLCLSVFMSTAPYTEPKHPCGPNPGKIDQLKPFRKFINPTYCYYLSHDIQIVCINCQIA